MSKTEAWSDWQQPIMDGYRMQCCDCGLIHEIQFRVYKVTERPTVEETYGPEMPDEYRVQLRMKRIVTIATDPLDERDFYELMQAYRHAQEWTQPTVVETFEAVKAYIRERHLA